MTEPRLSRIAALLGEEALSRLASSHVLLLGLGGVGGHAFDALVRTGVGEITVCDFDTVSESNMNRQLLADETTLGLKKADVAVSRAALLSHRTVVHSCTHRLAPEMIPAFLADVSPSLILDAVDDVPVKVSVAREASARGIPILTCLGTGNRLDPSALYFTDIAKTEGCPLARAVRTRLRRSGVHHLRVLASRETPRSSLDPAVPIGSCAYVPAVAGLMLAAEAVRLLLECREGEKASI